MDRAIDFLISTWEFDMWVFSQWWLYAPLLIPFLFYLVFYFLKWMIITLPLWLPFMMILGSLKDSSKKNDDEDRRKINSFVAKSIGEKNERI